MAASLGVRVLSPRHSFLDILGSTQSGRLARRLELPLRVAGGWAKVEQPGATLGVAGDWAKGEQPSVEQVSEAEQEVEQRTTRTWSWVRNSSMLPVRLCAEIDCSVFSNHGVQHSGWDEHPGGWKAEATTVGYSAWSVGHSRLVACPHSGLLYLGREEKI